MNKISEEKYFKADEMFMNGASIRKVSRELSIDRGTAHRIQKAGRLADLAVNRKTRINTGKKKNGNISFRMTGKLKSNWENQHYCKTNDFYLRPNEQKENSRSR